MDAQLRREREEMRKIIMIKVILGIFGWHICFHCGWYISFSPNFTEHIDEFVYILRCIGAVGIPIKNPVVSAYAVLS